LLITARASYAESSIRKVGFGQLINYRRMSTSACGKSAEAN